MKSVFKYVGYTILVTLLLTEFCLRLFGYKPGFWGKFEGFSQVDSLVVYKNFKTDEYGIYKFSEWVTDSLKKHYNWRTASVSDSRTKAMVKTWDQVNYIYTSYGRLEYLDEQDVSFTTKLLLYFAEEKEDWDTEFIRTYVEIKQKNNPTHLETAIKEYVGSPFNSDGFRSIDFKVHDTLNTRILLIGDSFVYGMAARPFFNSYPDILLTRGYEVYNAGIPGVEPAQYAAIVKKYVPLLNPDIVIVNFYEGNDLMHFPRSAEKGVPHEHATNAGFFESYPLGEYLTPEQAYEFYLNLSRIPVSSSINKLCALTAISSRLWGILYDKGTFKHPMLQHYYDFRAMDEDKAIEYTQPNFHIIDSVCKGNDVQLFNIIIPNRDAYYNQETTYINIDEQLAARLITNGYISPKDIFTEEDFPESDYHFNNMGSLKFADFIEDVIEQEYQTNINQE